MKRVIIVLAVLMAVSGVARAAVTIQDTLIKAVPEDAVVCATLGDIQAVWKSVSSSNAWQKIKGLKVWENADFSPGLEEFKAEFKENMGFDLSADNIMALIGKELTLALSGDPQTMQFNLIVMARPGDLIKAKGIVENFTKKVNDAGEDFSFKESKYSGASLWSLTPKEAEAMMPIQARYGFAKETFVFGIGMGKVDLEKIVDLLDGKGKSITAGSKFSKIMGHATAGQGSFSNAFFIDVAKLKELVKTIPVADPDAQTFIKAIENAMGQTDVMAGTIQISKGVKAKFASILTDTAVNKLAATLKTDPGLQVSGQHLKYVPKDAIVYFGGKIPGGATQQWNLFKQQMTEMGSDQMITEIINQIETNLEISFEQDVLSWIGDEITFVFAGMDTTKPFPFPKISVLAQVKDAAKPQALIDKLVAMANAAMTENMPEESGFKLELKKETVAGSSINTIELPMPQMGLIFQPGYSFVDKSLAIALDTDLIKEMIQAKNSNSNILGNKYFVSAGIPAKATSIGFINVEQGLLAAKDVALQIVSLAEMSGASEEAHNAVNDYVIPILDALGAVKAVTSYSLYAGDHVEGVVDIRVQDIN